MLSNCCVTARKTAQQKAKIRQDFRSKSAEWEGTFQGHRFEWAFLFSPWSKEKKQRLSRWLIFTSLATDAGEMWQHWGFQRPRTSGMHIITFRFIPAQLTIGITTQLTNTNVKSIHIAMYTEYICTQFSEPGLPRKVPHTSFRSCATHSISTKWKSSFCCVLREASALFQKNEKAINLVVSTHTETWNKTRRPYVRLGCSMKEQH